MMMTVISKSGESSLFGQVFVQSPRYEIGLSSYHFDSPNNSYINFEKWRDLGNLPNIPLRKNFTNVKFFPNKRTFIGIIDWTAEGGSPFNSSPEIYWLYCMVFDKDYSKIIRGHVITDGNEIVTSFSKDLNYIRLSLTSDKHLQQVDIHDIALRRQAEEQEDAQIQYELGVKFFSNEDYTRAAAWFRKSAEQGHAVAQRALGILYFQGDFGVPSSFSKAAHWFYKSAIQGDAEAQYRLGLMFENGYDIPQDDTKATSWYRKAAEQGHPEALEKLGF